METIILAAADFEKQKYFFEPKFQALPDQIKHEVHVLCVTMAQKLGCTFLIHFEADGAIYFETIRAEGDILFDEIGTELQIKEARRLNLALLESLQTWYRIFFTEDGDALKQELLTQEQPNSQD